MGMYIDLIGKQFGRLTVVGNTGKTKKPGGQIWECRCSCGNVVYKTTANLKKDNCKSCGCLRKEIMSRTGEERKKRSSYKQEHSEYRLVYTGRSKQKQ